MSQVREEDVLPANQVLDFVSEHTGTLKAARWLKHIQDNKQRFGVLRTMGPHEGQEKKYRYVTFDLTLDQLYMDAKGIPGVVLGAGPGFRRFGFADLEKILQARKQGKIKIIACDGALPMLDSLGEEPDYVVTVDAHPVVANFFRRSNSLKNVKVLMNTAIHHDVVDECLRKGLKLYWWQGFWGGENEKHGKFTKKSKQPRSPLSLDPEKFYVDGVPSVATGGNVGTTSTIIALQILGMKPLGLMGLEFAWSDETPFADTQYFDLILKAVGGDFKRAFAHFKREVNPRDGKTYVADPWYYSYCQMFKEYWKGFPPVWRTNTFNLTKEGILAGPDTPKFLDVDQFLKKIRSPYDE